MGGPYWIQFKQINSKNEFFACETIRKIWTLTGYLMIWNIYCCFKDVIMVMWICFVKDLLNIIDTHWRICEWNYMMAWFCLKTIQWWVVGGHRGWINFFDLWWSWEMLLYVFKIFYMCLNFLWWKVKIRK